MTDPPDDDNTTTDTDQPAGYAEAVAELDRILASLDDDGLDVDDLGRRVARAAGLIAWCRQRVAAARFEVEQVVAAMAPTDDTAER